MHTPEVSVIMPVYNGAKFVATAIESVLSGQDDVNFELVVADNASTDNTLEVVSRYASDSRLRIITNPKNLGIFGNLNLLVTEARGPLIKILCADDWMLEGGLSRQVSFMRDNPSLGVARCWSQLELNPLAGKGPRHLEYKLPMILPPQASALAFFAFGNLPGNLSNVICTKEALKTAGAFDQRLPYAGDYEMWVRVARKHAMGIHRVPCVHVTEHEGQATVTLNRNNELVAQVDAILNTLLDELPQEMRACARLHSTLTHGVHQASNTLHRLSKGTWSAWPAFARPRRHSYGTFPCLIAYFITLGGRWGYGFTTDAFLKRIGQITSEYECK